MRSPRRNVSVDCPALPDSVATADSGLPMRRALVISSDAIAPRVTMVLDGQHDVFEFEQALVLKEVEPGSRARRSLCNAEATAASSTTVEQRCTGLVCSN